MYILRVWRRVKYDYKGKKWEVADNTLKSEMFYTEKRR